MTLKTGEPAPAFKADKWLQGGPVDKLETGKMYVVEQAKKYGAEPKPAEE